MAEEDDPVERLKRETFGDLADRAELRVTGSGVSERQTISINLLSDLSRLTDPAAPWSENRAMILQLFEGSFARSSVCPGRDGPQCCRARPGMACFPQWREREDPEWYACEISKYLTLVDQRLGDVTPITAALAADEAFELGCLLTEACIKFRWDRYAIQGQKSADGAREGGYARRSAEPRRRSADETVAAVDALLGEGKKPMAAYRSVAKGQGVKVQTVAKEYRREKKQG